MHTLTRIGCLTALAWLISAPVVLAQDNSQKPTTNSKAADAFVAKMMAFDKNKDGKLTRDEITDLRLLRLFDRADANKDGVVTAKELRALFMREQPRRRGGRGGPGGFGGPEGDFGPPDGGFGPPGGGFGGPGGGLRGPPRPGQILPDFLQERLNLSTEQRRQLASLQKEVDARMDKILTADQKKMMQQMRRGGPGGFGPPGGGPGLGGPGAPGEGPPPDDDRPSPPDAPRR